MGEGPLKQVKLKPDVVESDGVPVTASFLIGDPNLEYVTDASTSYDIMSGVHTPHSKHAPVLSASSVPDSILSPVPTVKSPPIDCEDTVIFFGVMLLRVPSKLMVSWMKFQLSHVQ